MAACALFPRGANRACLLEGSQQRALLAEYLSLKELKHVRVTCRDAAEWASELELRQLANGLRASDELQLKCIESAFPNARCLSWTRSKEILSPAVLQRVGRFRRLTFNGRVSDAHLLRLAAHSREQGHCSDTKWTIACHNVTERGFAALANRINLDIWFDSSSAPIDYTSCLRQLQSVRQLALGAGPQPQSVWSEERQTLVPDSDIRDAFALALASADLVPMFSTLMSFRLQNCTWPDIRLPALHTLQLEDVDLTAMDPLTHWSACPSLKVLDLQACKLPLTAAENMTVGTLPLCLEQLHVCVTISEDNGGTGILDLEDLGNMPALRKLDLHIVSPCLWGTNVCASMQDLRFQSVEATYAQHEPALGVIPLHLFPSLHSLDLYLAPIEVMELQLPIRGDMHADLRVLKLGCDYVNASLPLSAVVHASLLPQLHTLDLAGLGPRHNSMMVEDQDIASLGTLRSLSLPSGCAALTPAVLHGLCHLRELSLKDCAFPLHALARLHRLEKLSLPLCTPQRSGEVTTHYTADEIAHFVACMKSLASFTLIDDSNAVHRLGLGESSLDRRTRVFLSSAMWKISTQFADDLTARMAVVASMASESALHGVAIGKSRPFDHIEMRVPGRGTHGPAAQQL